MQVENKIYINNAYERAKNVLQIEQCCIETTPSSKKVSNVYMYLYMYVCTMYKKREDIALHAADTYLNIVFISN